MTEQIQIDTRTPNDFHSHGYNGIEPTMLKDVLYLEQLSATTSMPIQSWPVIEMLKNVERGNKKAINKLFFDHIEKDKKEVLNELDTETFNRIENLLFTAAQDRKERQLEDLQARYFDRLRSCNRYAEQMREALTNAKRHHDSILDIERQTQSTVMGGFRKVLENKFFQFQGLVRSKATFVTSQDIVMRHCNKAANIDQTMNFGRIMFILDLKQGTLDAAMCSNNIRIPERGFYHPYISSHGSICFGNAQNAVNEALATCNFDQVFQVLASLLTNYDNNSAPWCAFQVFVDYEKKNPNRITPKPCEECGKVEGICECERCDHCLASGHNMNECADYCQDCEHDIGDCVCNSDDESDDESTAF